ncbi:MAG: Xaa-Pro dipeptidase [Candidatus Paceibacterota bacterium]|jgi:Xaa-Pro dipeptidase
MNSIESLFPAHIGPLTQKVGGILRNYNYGALAIHSGTPAFYHSDDQEITFHTLPHFRHWTPLLGPNHILIITPDARPELIIVAPEDYWYEHTMWDDPFWANEFNITHVGNTKAAWDILAGKVTGRNSAFIGDETASGTATGHGILPQNRNPKELLEKLDELRTVKSEYEVACIEKANKIAALGHARAYDAFFAGGSELDIHHAYLIGTKQAEADLPYPIITALDSKSAILHYQNKREERSGAICLLDAGVSHLGFASDVTRTWASPKADGRFVSIISALDTLQKELCEKVRPGVHTLELHYHAHFSIAHILKSHDIIYKEGDEAISAGLTSTFFPHGIGHFLGIQVHDVGSSNAENKDDKLAELFPKLRTMRKLEPGNVITIEPGIYFIPMLLKKLKESSASKFVNWELVEALTPSGGIRIEDNVLVTKEGHRNLTRQYFEQLDK